MRFFKALRPPAGEMPEGVAKGSFGRFFKDHAAWLLVVLATLALAFRLCLLVEQYAVDLLHLDQWQLYAAFIEERGWWDLFRWQHGPHRQGIGFWLTWLVAKASGWSTRAEAFTIVAVLFSAALTALFLRRRLWGPIRIWDVIIPAMFLTPSQAALLFHTPNMSHGPMPLFLIMACALAWTVPGPVVRTGTVVVLNFLLIHTGFGLLMGFPTLCVFAVWSWADWKKRSNWFIPLGGLLASAASLAVFFTGYARSAETFGGTALGEWVRYPQLVVLSLAHYAGLKSPAPWPELAGGLLFLSLVFIAWQSCIRGSKTVSSQDPASSVIFILTYFSLVFACVVAAGRGGFGVQGVQQSRYIPYLVPGFLGIYFYLIRRFPSNLPSMAFCLILLIPLLPLKEYDEARMATFRDKKTRWRDVFLQTKDMEAANVAAQFILHPEAERFQIREKLHYMEARGLNLFLPERPSQPPFRPASLKPPPGRSK